MLTASALPAGGLSLSAARDWIAGLGGAARPFLTLGFTRPDAVETTRKPNTPPPPPPQLLLKSIARRSSPRVPLACGANVSFGKKNILPRLIHAFQDRRDAR